MTKIKIKTCSILPFLLLFIFWLGFGSLAAPLSAKAQSQSMTDKEFKAMLARAIKDNPDIVMDVLRAHSAEVLDIAQQGNEEKRKVLVLEQWKKDAKIPKVIKLEGRPMKGAVNAPVLIAVYSDFTCPHCARAAKAIDDALINYPTKVRFVFKHRPLASHEYSRIAAQYFVAASLQSDIKAWSLYKGMFEGREMLIEKGEDFIIPLATGIGLDVSRLKKDINGAAVKKILDEDMEESKRFGFDGAPYLLFNNLVLAGPPSSGVMDLAISEAMKNK